MLIKIRHGLLKITNFPKNKTSSIILNDDIIITSAIILEPFFNENHQLLQQQQIQCVLKSLTDNELIRVHEDTKFEFFKSLKFEITFDEKLFNERSSRVLTKYRANLIYLYNCVEINECLENIFNILYDKNNHKTKKIFLSSFIILSLKRPDDSFKKSSLPNILSITRKLITYCKFLPHVNKLDDVMTICTPFGLESFYKSVNIGKISNVLGKNRCVFVISNTLPGCEGSAVFNNKLRLIGILVCTSLERENDNFNLSLVANFRHLIKDFTAQYGIQFGDNWISIKKQPPTWEKSLVMVICNESQGTGTLVKILDKKFIITCSHVLLRSDLHEITCRYINGTFTSKIIWKHPNFNEPFDIALISVPSNISDEYFVRLSNKQPRLGQTIYNAGFPFFTNFNTNDRMFTPAIFEGKIIKCSPGVLISDGTLQSGQSGGPMFDENGCVLAICISNIKLANKIYPNINTSVPVSAIKCVLESYVKTNDRKILNNLVASLNIKKIWDLETPFIDCKL